MQLSGQWLASISGPTNKGTAILNLEHDGRQYFGHACYFDDDPRLPGLVATVHSVVQEPGNRVRISLNVNNCIRLTPRQLIPTDKVSEVFPGANAPSNAELEGSLESYESYAAMQCQWSTNAATSGNVTLIRRNLASQSDLVSEILSWDDFKRDFADLSGRKSLFRGQQKRWILTSAFHRTGRCDLHHFDSDDLPTLARQLSPLTGRLYDLTNPLLKGALVNLVQHHGYPTPLLDWTLSPFIAAYFAFCDVPKNYLDDYVRIHILDEEMWGRLCVQDNFIDTPFPTLTAFRLLGIDNARMLPQQSVTTLSNLADIESFITTSEAKHGIKCLRAVDISTSERERAMAELRVMGITAASMFPGIDGACKALKEYKF